MRRGPIWLLVTLLLGGGSASAGRTSTTPVTTTCGVALVGRLPGGRRISLSSCADLVGLVPQASVRIDLKVGQELTVAAMAGSIEITNFTSSDPAVLSVENQSASSARFIARRPGPAQIFVTTGSCVVHNGRVAPCPVAPVSVTH
jgi:hypothetical protein